MMVAAATAMGILCHHKAPAGVHCPNCGTVSAQGARFCQQCGSSLAPAPCSRCGTLLPRDAKFLLEVAAMPPNESAAIAAPHLASPSLRPGPVMGICRDRLAVEARD
ncbi:zinc ribbon domain-containing protein (plasmid) [Cupriavidus basilensis]